MKNWRVIVNQSYDGKMNMAIDESIMKAVKEGRVKETLRFYTWNPPTVTIGYFQKLEEEIDLEACVRLGIDYVRRLTGGRAVLHEDELTYSIIAKEDNPMFGGIIPSYKFISEGLVQGLEMTGIKIDELSRGEKIGRDNLMAACFNAHSWYEITIGGKKVVGSAQTRKEGILLQHGSIITNFDAARLYEILKTRDAEEKARLIKIAQRKATGIENSTNIKVDLETLEHNLIAALAEHFQVEFQVEGLTEYELELAQQLYTEKYKGEKWNNMY